MVDPIFDYQFRLILLGDSTVGKSSLLKYFCEGKFSEHLDPTVGVDFYTRLAEVRAGVRVKLQLWDTAGQERFRSITRSYYRNSVGALIVYDITNRDSFLHVSDWLREAGEHMEPRKTVFLLIGHKTDMEKERQVSEDEGAKLAKFYDVTFFETSARTGENIEAVFQAIATKIYTLLEKGEVGVEEGWEGIKFGFGRPMRQSSFQLPTAEQNETGCC
ncbi:PREDICTED: ras-related protein Rab-39B-like [Priapulus caudatus]|uniref:Ras-related protein Rab-39B-like n=1 Tax=Priapulus caudatus TaxID=37621 RepID=A0ABM1EY97_PRICU|nr:PREDICTED: ras-related protein Rab-39B-like [Priapulus caudatus]